MRVKHKKWADPLIAAHPELMIDDATQFKGKWQSRFAKEHPLHLEVGMGKGQFIIGMAKAHPEINFIGLEIQRTVAAIALKKALEEDLPNLQLICGDGEDLQEYFEDGEVAKMYLNFSDPWPKKRHAKRRLTYKTFLATYQQILQDQGVIELKTDNMGLFEFSLESMNNYGMIFDGVWLDLHHSEENEHNVETEYEQKFAAKGQPIYKLIANFK
ncbi:tRNA (guanosine(46)-N7)-methyltransferase TrmB [Limosilactobacillus reuteri]|uniref:tRNA (guanosine(46)-N7)-methyltransferase TrmB n=1 Tax=Limosilactobacillus reuteri TaxID=1598 RepID=UPI00128DFD28|nr:tRNA (guanosine(46)-N7)-methyltransferase TrmB [Limosilactobacillus reuteri]MDD1401304.1 tRNA (guanosine(46)-N7)-methyltransferase TrmB [Limosilactobacillus reuteri]MQB76376.1 tRNA (guanosine(46)-N7)-methyltransferase TrmB [Limosilactobacillus reuteri]MQB98414.1 tRNA (guanosine(46)-N7)-methyltransferase TrmB [Limosilactobacillus reuteri]